MTDQDKVRARWPDAEISTAFAVQKDGNRKWMYCVMSQLKFMASKGKKGRVLNVGTWCFSEADAWKDAALVIP